MKKIFYLIIFITVALRMNAQSDSITLPQCLQSALNNKDDIKAARTDRLASGFQSKSVLAGYLPQVSAGYDFRYNIVIPAQIIPVGLFYPVPTDATQAIKFGTKWQQSLGLSLYQPLIDRTIKARLAESRINEKVQQNSFNSAEKDLQYEVINSYLLIWLKQQQVDVSALDTVRTFEAWQLLEDRYKDGRVYATDLNRAKINHNTALSLFRQSFTDLVKEKIYMSFLTGISLDRMLSARYDFTLFEDKNIFIVPAEPFFDSIPDVIQLRLNEELTASREKSERAGHAPRIGIEGFVGTNQYSMQFNPIGNAGWYGSSYVGLSLKLPLISGNGSGSKIDQLRLQQKSLNYRIQDKKAKISSENLRLMRDIDMLESQVSLSEHNTDLLKTNLDLFKDRYNKGLINSYDMLNSETDLQKANTELDKLRTELFLKKLELIRNSGMLGSFVQKLK